jgi:hypothetical protein
MDTPVIVVDCPQLFVIPLCFPHDAAMVALGYRGYEWFVPGRPIGIVWQGVN